MNRKFEFRSSILLIEIIITVFFFGLSSIYCIRLYLQAHNLTKRAKETTGSVLIAQDLAEAFLAAEGDPEKTETLLERLYDSEGQDTDSQVKPATLIESVNDAAIFSFEPFTGDFAPITYQIQFNDTFFPVSAQETEAAAYKALLSIGKRGDAEGLVTAVIQVTDTSGRVLYEIPELNYYQGMTEEDTPATDDSVDSQEGGQP